ncbi:MAG: thiamine pyrophosphate-dependent enzyme [Desulfobacterales bacterium]|nr:thiamine pyrophosphate-dependent enzyme [Desulfobacterales bacterium]
MVLIREFEERVKMLFLEGSMPGTIHQYQGQEACAVGVCAALRPDDVITSHPPAATATRIAKGVGVDAHDGRAVRQAHGLLQGQGRLHARRRPGRRAWCPPIAIVGGGIADRRRASALAFKMQKEDRVAVAFMGDGATNEGTFHEVAQHGRDLGPARAVRGARTTSTARRRHVSRSMKVEHIAERAVRLRHAAASRSTATTCWPCTRPRAKRCAGARAGKGPDAAGAGDLPDHAATRARPVLVPARGRAQARAGAEPIGRFAKRLVADGGRRRRPAGRAARRGEGARSRTAVRTAQADPEPTAARMPWRTCS